MDDMNSIIAGPKSRLDRDMDTTNSILNRLKEVSLLEKDTNNMLILIKNNETKINKLYQEINELASTRADHKNNKKVIKG